MIVRDFQPGDEAQLRQVFYLAVHVTAAADYSALQLNAWAPAEYDRVDWSRRMCDIRPLVVERDGNIIAFADVQPSGYIDMFFVSPTVARQGVGSLLMERIHEVASSHGTCSLFSNVSITARPFFERWGFTVEEPQTVTVRGLEFVNYRMRKRLNSAD